MSLNNELMEQYRQWCHKEPTYLKEGATFHTLEYVDWLESRLQYLVEQRADNSAMDAICPTCHGKGLDVSIISGILVECSTCNGAGRTIPVA
jgi:RecJ-like exonuclease